MFQRFGKLKLERENSLVMLVTHKIPNLIQREKKVRQKDGNEVQIEQNTFLSLEEAGLGKGKEKNSIFSVTFTFLSVYPQFQSCYFLLSSLRRSLYAQLPIQQGWKTICFAAVIICIPNY